MSSVGFSSGHVGCLALSSQVIVLVVSLRTPVVDFLFGNLMKQDEWPRESCILDLILFGLL